MQLSQLGGHVAQSGFAERQKHAQALMFGMADINEYVSGGVCYDAAAYVRYLLRSDAMIAPGALLDTIGQHWRTRFNFETGGEWDGRASIPAGTAVGFSRGGTVFHAAIAVGGSRIRAINGAAWAADGCMRSTSRACSNRTRPAALRTTARTFGFTCRACSLRASRRSRPRSAGRSPCTRLPSRDAGHSGMAWRCPSLLSSRP